MISYAMDNGLTLKADRVVDGSSIRRARQLMEALKAAPLRRYSRSSSENE